MGKLTGNYTLKEYADIVAKDRKTIRLLEEDLKESKSECERLRQEIENYKSSKVLNSTDEEIIKSILSLHAQGNMYKIILERLPLNFEGSIDDIRRICQNIDKLEAKYKEYYNLECESHAKNIKNDPNLINNTLIQVLRQNINDASQDLVGLTDVKEKSNLRAEITKHAKELTALTKNIAEDIREDSSNLVNEANKVMEEHTKTKLIGFKAVKKRVD